jgi:hypothetical protein
MSTMTHLLLSLWQFLKLAETVSMWAPFSLWEAPRYTLASQDSDQQKELGAREVRLALD